MLITEADIRYMVSECVNKIISEGSFVNNLRQSIMNTYFGGLFDFGGNTGSDYTGNYSGLGTNGNDKNFVQTLISKGVKPNIAIGVVANIKHESNLNSKAVGDNGTSFGLCQWHIGGEADNMAKEMGLNNQKEILNLSADQQLNYVAQLIKNRGIFNGNESPEDAAKAWCIKYERPANKEMEAEKRAATARNLAATMNTQQPTDNRQVRANGRQQRKTQMA